MLPYESTRSCCTDSEQPPCKEEEVPSRRRARWLRHIYLAPWSRIWGFCTALLNFLAAIARLFLTSD